MVTYKVAEKAFIINYADYCLKNKLNYDATMALAFQEKFKWEIGSTQLKSLWSRILDKEFSVQPGKRMFKAKGTACIDQGSLGNASAEFLAVMNRQREEMGLDKLKRQEDTAATGSAPITSGTGTNTETVDGGDVGSSARPVRIEETPEIMGSEDTTADGNGAIEDSNPAVGKLPTGKAARAHVTEDTVVVDQTATDTAVNLETTSSHPRPTPSPISPGFARPEVSKKVLRKRKASKTQTDDASPSKRPDRRAPEESRDRRSEVQATGSANLLHDKRPNDGDADNKASIALQLACAVYRRNLDSRKDVQHGILDTLLQKVQRIPDFREDAMIDMLLKDAESQRKLREKSEDMVASLVGELEYNTKTVFPKTPSHEDVDQVWTNFQNHVMYTAGHNYDKPIPRPGAAGYLSRSAEAIADGSVSADDLDNELEALHDCLLSPHAQQALLSALICRWIFSTPEMMSEGQHTLPVMKILEACRYSGGLQKVQHIDKLMTQQVFVDQEHQPIIARRERVFCQNFTKVSLALCKPHELQPPAIERLASAAILLKHKLMLSPSDYRIRYCRPETSFDPVWMKAVNAKNFPIADADVLGKEITLCMFPALMSQTPEAFGPNAKIEDALVMNKTFFPTSSEKRSLDPSLCLSKATVLVLL